MAAKRRQCVNCWFYRSADMSGYGWCVHPDRQQESSARLMVRNRELACRNSWGNDLFLHKDSDTPPDTGSLGVSPHHANPSGSDDVDDEVTSVVTPRSPGSHSPAATDAGGEDRVVSDRPSSRPDNRHEADDGLNDAARLDQEERARVIARGSGDAIASARARYFERRRQGRSAPPDDDTTDAAPAGDTVDSTGANAPDSAAKTGRVVSQQERLSHRFTRHKTGETFEASREEPVPRSEVEQHHRGSLDRFDSVPEIDPNFDLPGWRRNDASTEPPSDATSTQPVEPVEIDEPEPTVEAPSEDVDEVVDEVPIRTYEHVLNRARRIRETRKSPRARTQGTVSRLADTDLPELGLPPPDDHWPEEDHHPGANDEGRYAANANYPSSSPANEEYRPQRQGSAQGERRRSWLARFSSNRDHRSPHAEAAPANQPTIQPSFDQNEAFGIDEPGHLDHHADHGWQDDNPYVAMNALPDDMDRWDDTGDLSQEALHDDAWEDDEPMSDLPPRHAPATQRERSTLAALPDIEDLFATPPPIRQGTRQPEPAPRRETRPSSAMASGKDTRSAGPRRWSAEEPYSPRDSFFRSQRYRDWQAEDKESAGETVEAFTDPDYADGDLGEMHDTRHTGQLPDLDASSFDLRDVISRGSELLDMTIDIAPEIPRECRTCRSFRSADGGARGWCTNEWAFTHRRMVNEDDLACETAIGSWWLPDDRYWMPEEDTTRDDATPRMNAFLRRFSTTRKRKISGE